MRKKIKDIQNKLDEFFKSLQEDLIKQTDKVEKDEMCH